MNSSETGAVSSHVRLTAEIVASFVAHNSLQTSELPKLIEAVHSALAGLGTATTASDTSRPIPIVSIKKSIGDDYLISMEDGQRYKSLKRHLSGRGLTPQQYREKWSLPYDYPMVAPSYAKQRSELAKSMGLGRRKPAPEPVAAPASRARRSRAG